jgi:hypothetical protein
MGAHNIPPLTNVTFCAVLGNHDYRGDVAAQLSPILQKIDSRWLCQRSFILNAGRSVRQSAHGYTHIYNIYEHPTISNHSHCIPHSPLTS